MVRRRLLFGAAALLALAGARPAAAGSINFATGNVEKDMASTTPGVLTIVNRAQPFSASSPVQPSYMTALGRQNGWEIKDLRVTYDEASDRLFVGVNFFGTAGDIDGNGVVGTADPASGVSESAMLGYGTPRDDHISVGIDMTGSGKPTIVAGIGSNHMDPSKIGPGTWGFSVNSYSEASAGLGASYGASLNAMHNGNLAFAPSADHPDFEFSIANFSKIPGFNKETGFGFIIKAGSSQDKVVGEEELPYTKVSYQQLVPATIPEPATMLAWSIVAGGAAWRGVSRRRKGDSSVL